VSRFDDSHYIDL